MPTPQMPNIDKRDWFLIIDSLDDLTNVAISNKYSQFSNIEALLKALGKYHINLNVVIEQAKGSSANDEVHNSLIAIALNDQILSDNTYDHFKECYGLGVPIMLIKSRAVKCDFLKIYMNASNKITGEFSYACLNTNGKVDCIATSGVARCDNTVNYDMLAKVTKKYHSWFKHIGDSVSKEGEKDDDARFFHLPLYYVDTFFDYLTWDYSFGMETFKNRVINLGGDRLKMFAEISTFTSSRIQQFINRQTKTDS